MCSDHMVRQARPYLPSFDWCSNKFFSTANLKYIIVSLYLNSFATFRLNVYLPSIYSNRMG